jgi:hypothetical protein
LSYNNIINFSTLVVKLMKKFQSIDSKNENEIIDKFKNKKKKDIKEEEKQILPDEKEKLFEKKKLCKIILE